VNVTAIAARDGILIIDTGRSPSLMREIAARIEPTGLGSDNRVPTALTVSPDVRRPPPNGHTVGPETVH
jgi:hypothetical protein